MDGGNLGPRECVERLCRHYRDFYMKEKKHANITKAEE